MMNAARTIPEVLGLEIGRLEPGRINGLSPSEPPTHVSGAGRLHSLPLENVLYFQSRDHIIHVFFADDNSRRIRKKISILEQALPARFFRIHKSFIVSLPEVQRLIAKRGGKYRVELSDGTLLPVSRRIYPCLRRLFSERTNPAQSGEFNH